MFPHAPEEGFDIIHGRRVHELAIVEDKTDPEIVHENGESRHDRDDTPWATEFIPADNCQLESGILGASLTRRGCRASGPSSFPRLWESIHCHCRLPQHSFGGDRPPAAPQRPT